MHFVAETDAEPIPGYRLLEPLGRGGFGEVWKCEAPGGLVKALKFVSGPDDLDTEPSAADEEWRAIERIKSLRHPFLLSVERVERLGPHLIIVTELADCNLDDLLRRHRRAGSPGIPRDELLNYVAEAAEALDLMNLRHGLQHLDVKPKNLFLVSNHVKVADFGLVSSLVRHRAGATGPGAATPLYTSPEVFAGGLSAQSDQYSLAAVYHELLTGALVFDGRTAAQLAMQHTRQEPDLGRLPPSDVPAVARALTKVPGERFASCTEFVQALRGADGATALPRAAESHSTIKMPEPLDGYRLVRCEERTPLTEIWLAEGPDGRPRQVKYVYGLDRRDGRSQQEAVTRLRGLSHPALAPVEVLLNGRGSLALVSEAPGPTLRDHWQECRAAGGAGLPRAELLKWLRETATALDALFERFGLAHLAINPRTVRREGERLVLADFGLVPLFWLPAGRSRAQFNPRHGAPELDDRQATRAADQYSLALMYHELLTGGLPPRARGRWLRSLTRGRRPDFDLSQLAGAGREAVARALHDDPARRFGSCAEFVRALKG